MEEPPLRALARRGVETFRFLYLPSFRHPIVVRIQRSKEGLFLVLKKLNGRGGSNPGVLMVDEQRVLPDCSRCLLGQAGLPRRSLGEGGCLAISLQES
jgi:hypothetical protein